MSISTLSFNNSSVSTILKLKTQQQQASYEALNKRHQDVGLALGRLTGTAVSYRVQETSIEAQLETNKVVASRLDQSYDALGSISTQGDSISSSLLSAEKFSDYPALATSALQQMQSSLNTSVGGVYLFAGTNSDKAPIPDVDAGIAAAKTKFADFLTALGKTAGQVTSAEMTGFLSDAGYSIPALPAVPGSGTTVSFMDTVNDANWDANWSTATDEVGEANISKSETIKTSVSANEVAIRKVTAAYSMLAAIGGESLGTDTKQALTKAAAVTLTAGKTGITALRATIGNQQNRVDAADTALTKQKDIVTAAFTSLEGVDQTEASVRLTALETQLQAAYTITGRLQKLSILDYL